MKRYFYFGAAVMIALGVTWLVLRFAGREEAMAIDTRMFNHFIYGQRCTRD